MEALLVSITSVALGELGDKTQILSLVLAARWRKPLPIILGILVATLGNHLLACLVGSFVGQWFTPQVLRWVLGISFLAVAAWVLVPDKLDSEEVKTRSNYGVFALTVFTFFIAEMGDKTQVVAIALAARFPQFWSVVAGTTIGMMLVNVPTVLFAERAMRWIPLKTVRVLAALVYGVLGALTLAGYSAF